MAKPFKQKVGTELDTHVIVYVPSTGGGQPFQSRIKETSDFLTKLFGGTTKIRTVGTFKGKSGETVAEKVTKIEIFSKPEDWKRHNSKVREYLIRKKKEWNQEELAFEFEEDLFFV